MTVTDLREVLQRIELQGMGGLEVLLYEGYRPVETLVREDWETRSAVVVNDPHPDGLLPAKAAA